MNYTYVPKLSQFIDLTSPQTIGFDSIFGGVVGLMKNLYQKG